MFVFFVKSLISSSLSHKSQYLAICFSSSSLLSELPNRLAMVSTRELQTEASQSGEIHVLASPKFPVKATTILCRILAERRIGSFQVEHQRKKEQPDKTLQGLCITGRLKEAVGLLWRSRLQLDPKTYSILLQECIQRNEYTKGKQIHAQMVLVGFSPNEFLKVKLLIIYALSRDLQTAGILYRSLQSRGLIPRNAMISGSVSDGQRVFDQFPTRNVVTWTSLMSGYGYHGQVLEVLKCFDKMKEEGCRPNSVTFLVVLTACSHGGLVDKGQEHFDSMKRDYGIEPEGQHYASMVDILGRAGRIQEAYEFVMKSPCKKHAPIWGSLLGACRNHGNVKLLELAATKYFELDPTNGGNYVVFANGYASCGLLDAASKVRRRMENAGVKKDPGFSQIELQSEVHRFMKNDTSHRLSGKIYKKVQEMTSLFRDVDYYPDDLDASCPVCDQNNLQLAY